MGVTVTLTTVASPAAMTAWCTSLGTGIAGNSNAGTFAYNANAAPNSCVLLFAKQTYTFTQGWTACGVTFSYAGLSDKTPGKMDGENVIGWKEDGKNYSAWTSWRARRNGHALEADITLYANIFNT